MRENPLVCVQTDEVRAHNEWESVVVLGRYEDTSGYSELRRQAQSVLEKRSMWWQTAYAASQSRVKPKPGTPLFYCIHIEEVSGHKATPDEIELALSVAHVRKSGR